MKKEITYHSPKNRYRIEFTYRAPVEEIGSVSSFGVMTLEGLEENQLFQDAKKRGPGSYTISENKATYPAFDWHRIKTVEYN